MNPLVTKIIALFPSILKKKRSWAMMLVLLGAGYFVTGNLSSGIDWMWKEPRDVLVDRVQEARDSQHAAAEQFRDALTEFKAVVDLPESGLERQYNKLNAAHKRSKAAADRISKRIDRVVDASNRLLDEWSSELDDYNDPGLRRIAEQQFDQTREHATRLIATMRQIEDRMQPVLASFQDQVLYLKHNLNLSAIAALEGEATIIESNVDILIADMNRSIAEADAFIAVILERG
jgi:TPP-dependent trihydroxycyclohexane-1,2-dione (THcHDO) dehydratase